MVAKYGNASTKMKGNILIVLNHVHWNFARIYPRRTIVFFFFLFLTLLELMLATVLI